MIGFKKDELLLFDDEFGLYFLLKGMECFYKDGKMVVVYGCGYDNLSFLYFELMGFWYIGVLNVGEVFGWFGCFVDLGVKSDGDLIVNIGFL